MAGDKYLYNNAGVTTEKAAIQSSAGAGDAGKIPALDAAGLLDITMMPVGIGADTASLSTAETIASGDLVYINGSGAVAKADNTDNTKNAMGFCPVGGTHPTTVTVYFEGKNTALSGMTPGAKQYLGTNGGRTETAPSAAGNAVQCVGRAIDATTLSFEPNEPIVVA